MAHPEYIYYALMVLLVLPSIMLNRMALVITLCWLPGQLVTALHALHLLGEPPLEYIYLSNALLDAIALFYGAMHARNTGNLLVTVLFLPLSIVNALGMEHVMMEYRHGFGLHPYYVWWMVFWFAVAQALFVPLGNNWRPVFQWMYRKGWIGDPNANFHFFKWDRPTYPNSAEATE